MLSALAAPGNALPGPLGRHQVVGAVRRLLLAAAQRRLLLQIDDAHLADDADVDVLVQLAIAARAGLRPAGHAAPAAGSALARGLARLQRAGALQVSNWSRWTTTSAAAWCRARHRRRCPTSW